MKPAIRSRIGVVSRVTMIAALLVAGLVILASRLRGDPAELPRSPATPGSTSSAHSRAEPTPEGAPPATGAPSPMVAPPTQPATATLPAPTLTATPTLFEPTPDVSGRIGILAGHWGYDTGAVCDDGLREVDITTDIARRTAARLRSLGYEVDILEEHDPDKPAAPLQDYLAAAFVSLHVDSCLANTSGFKVTRWAFSRMPEIEDRLVECLYQEYGAATGLTRHDNSITIDMWNYYAFREIAELTPGAIIELGFMVDDRWLLVQQPDLAAEGVVRGVLCFLNGPAGE